MIEVYIIRTYWQSSGRPDRRTHGHNGSLFGLSSLQGFILAEVDPETLEHRILYDNGKALINGVSVAIEAGEAYYVGSFQGDRVVKVTR